MTKSNYTYGQMFVRKRGTEDAFRVSCICNMESKDVVRILEDLPLPPKFSRNSYGVLEMVGGIQRYIPEKRLKKLFATNKMVNNIC